MNRDYDDDDDDDDDDDEEEEKDEDNDDDDDDNYRSVHRHHHHHHILKEACRFVEALFEDVNNLYLRMHELRMNYDIVWIIWINECECALKNNYFYILNDKLWIIS